MTPVTGVGCGFDWVNNGLYGAVPLDALARAGVIRVPLNARLSLAEHTQMLVAMDVDLLVFGPDLVERAEELAVAVPGLRLIGLGAAAGLGDLLDLAERAPSDAPVVAIAPDDVVLALYTSGTTGVLKAAEHTRLVSRPWP